MNITSPEASFLNFNYVDTNPCDDEADIALPVCGDLAIKAQIGIENNTLLEVDTNPIYVAVCDSDCNVVIDNDTQVQPICSTYKFKTVIEGEEIDETSQFNLCNEDYKTPIDTIDFAACPFNPITSTDLTFDFHHYITGEDEVQLQLYIQNKVYIIEWSLLLSSPYSIQVADNVNFVKVKHYLSPTSDKASLLNFFTSVIDVNHGTTTTESGGTFTVANMPSISYINNNAFVDTPATLGSVTNEGKFFYWNNSAIHYTALSKSDNVISYKYNYTLSGGQAYSIRYKFDSLYTNFSGNIIVDDGISPVSYPFSVTDYSGEIEAFFFATGGSNDITIEITNTNGHLNGFNIQDIFMYETVIYNVYASTSGIGYAQIPLGEYSKSSLKDKISELLGFDFDCEFTQCCNPPIIQFSADYGEGFGVSGDYTLTPYWNKGYIDFPAIPTCGFTYSYQYEYQPGSEFSFNYCSFSNILFTDIYIEGDPTNYGGDIIPSAEDLWGAIMAFWEITADLCTTIYNNTLLPEITFTVNVDGAISIFKMTRTETNNTCLDCFTYCILDSEKDVIACSNQFQVTNDCCYVTKIEYSNNEDAFGFSYPASTPVTNTIQLPFFMHSPKHLTKEKIYRRTDGTYRRLSADIEKEYECETDFFHEYLHDKLIVALKHDNVTVTSNRLNITEQVSQQGDYSMNWNAKIDFTAKAEFKLRTYFNGKNNNCGGGCY